MRLTDLLNHPVVDERGNHLGHVHEARVVQDGPMTASFENALRLHGLYVGRGSIGRRLGYRRGIVRGPWLLSVILGRGHVCYVPWARIKDVGDTIAITGDGHDLPPSPEAP